MKLPKKDNAGGTESLGEYCVRSFSRDSESCEPGFIGLFSGVPVMEHAAKKRGKKAAVFDGVHGKVIT